MGETNWIFQLCWVIRWIKSWWRLIAPIDRRNAPWWHWDQKWPFETTFYERTNQFEENGRLFQVRSDDFTSFFNKKFVYILIITCLFTFSSVVIKQTWADFCAVLDKNFPCIRMTCWKITLIGKLCLALTRNNFFPNVESKIEFIGWKFSKGLKWKEVSNLIFSDGLRVLFQNRILGDPKMGFKKASWTRFFFIFFAKFLK